jgi:hypothetical protein
MKTVKLTEEQQNLLIEIDSAGVEVQYLLSVRNKDDEEDYCAHKQAALSILEKIQKDTDEYFKNLLSDEKYKNNKRSDFHQIEIDRENLEGNRILLQEFLGRYYSVEKQKCALRGQSSNFLNSYFWAGDNETQNNALDIDKEFGDLKCGYAYAFFEPPYNIRGSMKEKERLFLNVENLFFGRFDSRAQIWKWSDNCSNFFDAGKEWWGTYFYTYAPPDSQIILGIAASATD